MSQKELKKRLYIVAIDTLKCANKKQLFAMGKNEAMAFINMARKG